MAIQIQETPVLKGKDATAFLDNLNQIVNHNSSEAEKKAKEDDLKRMKANYDRLHTVLNGAF
jgi:hypothetical protein